MEWEWEWEYEQKKPMRNLKPIEIMFEKSCLPLHSSECDIEKFVCVCVWVCNMLTSGKKEPENKIRKRLAKKDKWVIDTIKALMD